MYFTPTVSTSTLKKEKKKKMGIVAIVDVLITASSVQVQVELHEPHIWQYTDIWCAAYPHPPFGADPWATLFHVHLASPTNELHNMPPIHMDAYGNNLVAEGVYWVRCRADETFYGDVYNYYLQTIVTTHEPDGCHSGVHYFDPAGNEHHIDVLGPIEGNQVDVGHTVYKVFPSNIRGINVYPLPRPLPAQSQIQMTCCRGEECVFWVTLYVCTGCTGQRENGLRSNLLSSGWDEGACSPRFDNERKTVSFHKHVNANQQEYNEIVENSYDEIAIVFGLEGCTSLPWCTRPGGPHLLGAGSCASDCPSPFDGE